MAAREWSLDRVSWQAPLAVITRLDDRHRRCCACLARRYYLVVKRIARGPLPAEDNCRQGTKYWLSIRGLISGSNAAARCGVSMYSHPATEAQLALGLIPPPPSADEEPARWQAARLGQQREDTHGRLFCELVLPRRYRQLACVGIYRHPTISFMTTSPGALRSIDILSEMLIFDGCR
jgi:hypothetical protein